MWYIADMKNITFFVTKWEDGYFVATAQEESIVTQAKTLDELIQNIEEAVSLHFEDQPVKSPYTVVLSSNMYAS